MKSLITLVAATTLLTFAACEDTDAVGTRTPTPIASATAGATGSPSPTAATEVTATPDGSAPGGSAPGTTPKPPAVSATRVPALPPDTSVGSPVQPPHPAPTATPQVRVPSATPPPLDPLRRRELAPIEELSVRIAESAPPQLFVDVTTGLPGGCAAFNSVTLERSGNTVTLTMWNSMPSSPTACTAIYGYMRHTVPLGPFQPGTYVLRVNDQSRQFTVQ